MRFFQYLRAIFESFYSQKLYRDIALLWKGRGFLYLFLLIVIAAFAVFNALDTKSYAPHLYQTLLGNDDLEETEKLNRFFEALTEVTAFRIDEGIAKLDGESPFMMYNMLKEPVIYIDTREGQSLDSADIEPTVFVAFFRKDVVFLTEGTTPKTIPYNELTREDLILVLEEAIDYSSTIVSIAGFIGVFLGSLVIFLFSIAITSLLAVVMQAVAKHHHVYHLTYKDCQRLSAVAFTPALIAKAIIPAFAFANVAYFLMTLGYIYFAVKANKHL